MCDKLVAINNINTSGFALKTKYDTGKSYLQKEISDADKKIPNISGLATNSAFTDVEEKIADISSLVKKTDYDAKISKIKNKYITTDDYNKFTKDIAANKIKSKILVDKSAVVGFMNNDDLYKK